MIVFMIHIYKHILEIKMFENIFEKLDQYVIKFIYIKKKVFENYVKQLNRRGELIPYKEYQAKINERSRQEHVRALLSHGVVQR